MNVAVRAQNADLETDCWWMTRYCFVGFGSGGVARFSNGHIEEKAILPRVRTAVWTDPLRESSI